MFAEIETLRTVSSYGIEVDHIDLEAATHLGVPVTNVPDYSVNGMSSYAVTLLLDCARSVTWDHEHVDTGGWDREIEWPIERPHGRTGRVRRNLQRPRQLACSGKREDGTARGP